MRLFRLRRASPVISSTATVSTLTILGGHPTESGIPTVLITATRASEHCGDSSKAGMRARIGCTVVQMLLD